MKLSAANNPIHHTQKLKAQIRQLVEHLRADVGKVTEPKAQALFETSAEVLTGLVKAFGDYEQQHEQAWRPATLASRPKARTAARRGLALLAAGLFFATPGARAESKLSTADKDFIHTAALGGMTEVKLGELAARKGTRDDVKAFGQMMVQDHTAINANLRSLATQKSVTLPETLDTEHQGMLDKLTALPDSEFDAAYIAAMLTGHKQVAQDFKAEAADTQDADLKSFVDKSLPVVEAHLKRITALKQ